MELITFSDQDGNEVEFGIIAETMINGNTYILIAEPEEDEENGSEVYVMKDITKGDAEEKDYEMVEGEEEDALLKVFEKLLEGEDIEFFY